MRLEEQWKKVVVTFRAVFSMLELLRGMQKPLPGPLNK
jgi:hypothetical protein